VRDEAPPPHFASAREFGLWALNAPGVTMDQKLRAMQVLATLETKGGAEPAKKPAAAAEEEGSIYAPRKVRGFGVVTGGR
jgi:hypothetical protein